MAYVLAYGSGGHTDLSIQVGFDPSAVVAYQQHYVDTDVILKGFIDAKADPGDWIGNSQSVVPDSQLRRSEIFNDFMKPNGVAHQCGATLSGLDSGLDAGICMMRSEAGGAFEPETIALLGALAPHVKRALQLHNTLEKARLEGAVLRHAAETVDLAIVSVDGRGEILNITQAAKLILDRCDGLLLEQRQIVLSTRQSIATSRSYYRARRPPEPARMIDQFAARLRLRLKLAVLRSGHRRREGPC